MINVYITNLGKYNEGYLIGKWVELPICNEDLDEVLDEIGINEEYEEYFITDYETDLGIRINEYESISRLNELAEKLDSLKDYEVELLKAIIDVNGTDLEDALDILVSQNFTYILDVKNDKELGERMVELGFLGNIPESVKSYIDYEKVGREEGMNYSISFNSIAILCY